MVFEDLKASSERDGDEEEKWGNVLKLSIWDLSLCLVTESPCLVVCLGSQGQEQCSCSEPWDLSPCSVTESPYSVICLGSQGQEQRSCSVFLPVL